MDLADQTHGQLLLDLIMHGLRINDKAMNEVAGEMMTRYGQRPIRRLLCVAFSRKFRPSHRVRVLEALARLRPHFAEVAEIGLLFHDRHEDVQAAAKRVLRLAMTCPPANDDAEQVNGGCGGIADIDDIAVVERCTAPKESGSPPQ